MHIYIYIYARVHTQIHDFERLQQSAEIICMSVCICTHTQLHTHTEHLTVFLSRFSFQALPYIVASIISNIAFIIIK